MRHSQSNIKHRAFPSSSSLLLSSHTLSILWCINADISSWSAECTVQLLADRGFADWAQLTTKMQTDQQILRKICWKRANSKNGQIAAKWYCRCGSALDFCSHKVDKPWWVVEHFCAKDAAAVSATRLFHRFDLVRKTSFLARQRAGFIQIRWKVPKTLCYYVWPEAMPEAKPPGLSPQFYS